MQQVGVPLCFVLLSDGSAKRVLFSVEMWRLSDRQYVNSRDSVTFTQK